MSKVCNVVLYADDVPKPNNINSSKSHKKWGTKVTNCIYCCLECLCEIYFNMYICIM